MQWSAGVLVLGLAAGGVIMHLLQQSASAGGQPVPAAPAGKIWSCDPQAVTKATAGDARPPLGTWERNAGLAHITLTCTPERLEGVIVLKLKEEKTRRLTVDFRADYGVTRDSMLYGVVTCAGIATKAELNDEERLEVQTVLESAMVDQPFSMRFRMDDDILMLKDVRFHLKPLGEGEGLKDIETELVTLAPGRYTRKAGGKPVASVP
jgi:hypothetical protein